MFESAELGHRVSREVYRRREPVLRAELLEAQRELKAQARFPVLIVIGGVDGAGKGETVNLLNAWMDPRHIRTHAFPAPSDEERERPRMWRYWRALPPRGTLGILFGAWHTDPIVERVARSIDGDDFGRRIDEVLRFEQMLVDEGVLLLKYWFHLSRRDQKARLESLSADRLTRWRVTREDWARFAQYDRFRKVSGEFLRRTSTAGAPWQVVEGLDPAYRSLTVGESLLAALRDRLARPSPVAPPRGPAPVRSIDRRNLLDTLHLRQPLGREDYAVELERWQGRLARLSREPRMRRRAVVAVFEGHDAAGKGGAIRRTTAALDARQYAVVPVAAPTEEELAQPYLWRFWRHVPRRGRFALFDRSWYGRVLVERVEGLCAAPDWMRAYSEINDFEAELSAHGIVVVKFWLAIGRDEQLRRFRERERVPFKNHKITPEDWRNRRRWSAYADAVCDMVDRTSTDLSPWTLVEADNKLYARVKVLRTLCERVEAAIAAG
jgi:polyphosphate:AMP phosphotransferase